MPAEKDNGINALEDLKNEVRGELAKGANEGAAEAEAAASGPAAGVTGDDDQDPADPEADAADAEKDDKGKSKERPKRDWKDAQRDRFRARAQEERSGREGAEATAAQALQEVARLRALLDRKEKGETVDPADVAKPKSVADIERDAVEKAKAAIRAEDDAKTFVGQADSLYDNGVKAFGKDEFDEARTNVIGFGSDFGLFKSNEGRVLFLQQLFDSVDNPERVLFLMGQDPEEAERIVSQSERKRIASFVKLSTARQRKQPVSEAPEPIEEIKPTAVTPTRYSGAGTPGHVIDKMFDETMGRIRERRRG